MKTVNLKIGKKGEDLAVEKLRERGYKILGRNLRLKWGEIDILARDKDTLVVVEVKTKTSNKWGTPEEMVNYKKLNRLKLLALTVMSDWSGPRRVDVVAIDLDNNGKLRGLRVYEAVS